MKTSSAKAKGLRCSKEVKELLLNWCPDLKMDDIIVTSSGDTGEDLKLSPAAREVYPLNIECKNQEKLNIWAALDQAESHRKDTNKPALFFKRNNSDLYVALRAEDLMWLIR